MITTVIDIAQHLHPQADLTTLAELLPVQLELGIPTTLVPIALHAGSNLRREDYLRLHQQEFGTPEAVLDAEENLLLACVGGDRTRLRILVDAAHAAADTQTIPDLADMLPAASD